MSLDQKMSAVLRKITDSGLVPGNAIMIGKDGRKIYEKYNGYADLNGSVSIDPGTVYRMYSMTKVVTAVAVLQLWEKGGFQMDDPVSDYIPEYGSMRVVRADGSVHAAKNKMTVRHLLTMTSGIGYSDDHGYYADFAKRWNEQIVEGKAWDTVRAAKELTKVPLLFEPGERYCYGFSYDVLGALVEVISGMNLKDYCRKFIFAPLGMMDSGFEIDENNRGKMAAACRKTPDGLAEYDGIDCPVIDVMRFTNPVFYSGGAGLVSTLEDYFTFTWMLAEGGALNGVRILNKSTVDMMRRPQLTNSQRMAYNDPKEDASTFGLEYTYGFGVRVLSDPQPDTVLSPDEWGWSGALGTWMAIDPEEHIFFVYAHQHNPPLHKTYVPEIWQAIREAL
ncbi:MAG: beta-lactamase family protein [Clostridia bacterium]|nr:beta-lactamase family protein [Clostridia bacterium]